MTSTQATTNQRLERSARIEHLRLALGVRLHGFVSLKRFGVLVAKEEGRAESYDQSTAKRWEDGAAPGLGAVEAMARLARRSGLLYVTRTWIAFGDEGIEEVRSAPAVPDIELPPRAAEIDESDEPQTKSGAPRMTQRKQVSPGALLGKGSTRRGKGRP